MPEYLLATVASGASSWPEPSRIMSAELGYT
jgi:hypothetical protein